MSGETAGLRAFKQHSRNPFTCLLIDEYPPDWFAHDESTNQVKVKVSYRHRDGTDKVEYLTYVEMLDKFKGVIGMMPDNGRM